MPALRSKSRGRQQRALGHVLRSSGLLQILVLFVTVCSQMPVHVDDPSMLPSSVEEILRYEPAVQRFRRTATQDTEIRGREIKEDDPVVIWYPAANRDEEIFEDPDRFDVARHPNEHLSFGIGEHFCLGASLARLELNAIFDEMVPRLRNPEFAGPVRRLRSNFINGVKEMPVRFEPGERSTR